MARGQLCSIGMGKVVLRREGAGVSAEKKCGGGNAGVLWNLGGREVPNRASSGGKGILQASLWVMEMEEKVDKFKGHVAKLGMRKRGKFEMKLVEKEVRG